MHGSEGMICLDFLEKFPEFSEFSEFLFFVITASEKPFCKYLILTVFGIVILADSELHSPSASFLSQSHVRCHTNDILNMLLFGFIGHN